MRRAKEEEDRFVVNKRGEPQVIIMGIKDFLMNVVSQPELLATIRAEGKRKGKAKLTMREIDQEIARYRRKLD